MTLVRWDDRERVINQEKADQNIADKVSGKVDFRGEVMCSKKTFGNFKEEWVGGQARVTTEWWASIITQSLETIQVVQESHKDKNV